MSAFDVLTVSALLELIPLSDPPSKVVTASDWASVITAMTSQISVSTVVGVLATLVTAGIGLVFLRTPHHKNTRPIPAVTRVASTPTTVLTLI